MPGIQAAALVMCVVAATPAVHLTFVTGTAFVAGVAFVMAIVRVVLVAVVISATSVIEIAFVLCLMLAMCVAFVIAVAGVVFVAVVMRNSDANARNAERPMRGYPAWVCARGRRTAGIGLPSVYSCLFVYPT